MLGRMTSRRTWPIRALRGIDEPAAGDLRPKNGPYIIVVNFDQGPRVVVRQHHQVGLCSAGQLDDLTSSSWPSAARGREVVWSNAMTMSGCRSFMRCHHSGAKLALKYNWVPSRLHPRWHAGNEFGILPAAPGSGTRLSTGVCRRPSVGRPPGASDEGAWRSIGNRTT